MPFSEYDINPTVTVSDVRTAFGDADATSIPDATIEQKIEEEELIVSAQLPDDLDELEVPEGAREEAVEMLIKRRAARESWHSSPTAVRKQALDSAVSYDVQSFRGRLNDNVEEAYAVLGLDRGGDRAAFVDATGSSFKDRNKTNDRLL